ncbi:hypothetical protein CEQ90_18000 [Lewinellaceae bacterium SD302]|nr:hypothetical protein CEQ90_18000 [Lewinellaceae bacterium SD302]
MYLTSLFRGIVLLITLLLASSATGQEQLSDGPYHISFGREVIFGGTAVVSGGLAIILQNNLDRNQPFLSELNVAAYEQINGFDRLGSIESMGNARKFSDYSLYTSVALPALLFTNERMRGDFTTIGLLYLESLTITAGLTSLSKSAFARPRPYVYGPEWNPEDPLKSGDRAAFVSGHTSLTATGAFFFARVLSDYYPDSKLKPYAWGLAVTLPALTGYLRVKGGRHYPTDVIGGYLLGAAVGYFVPVLHRKEILGRNAKFNIGPTGACLSLKL